MVTLQVDARPNEPLPLEICVAMCGFPSPADDYLDRPLDFSEALIENPAATFAVRVAGESMTGAGICPGDIAVVNRARNAVDGCVVFALVDGEFTSSATDAASRCWLQPENAAFQDLEITEDMTFGYCRSEFQDDGVSADPILRKGIAEYSDPEFSSITGISGAPMFDVSANALCGMVVRGSLVENRCQIYFVDIFDIMRRQCRACSGYSHQG